MKKIIVKKIVRNNLSDVMDVVSKMGIPNRGENVVRKQINSIDPQNPLTDATGYNFIGRHAIEKSLLNWHTENKPYPETGLKPLPLGVIKVKYELCNKKANQTCIKYTISYNTMRGVSGFFYDKFMVGPALKKIARKNLDQLENRLTNSSAAIAA